MLEDAEIYIRGCYKHGANDDVLSLRRQRRGQLDYQQTAEARRRARAPRDVPHGDPAAPAVRTFTPVPEVDPPRARPFSTEVPIERSTLDGDSISRYYTYVVLLLGTAHLPVPTQ